jgi:anti-anti-sigma factor
LGLLVQISSKCKARQQKLKLAGVQPTVRQVFSITRLDRVFDFAPNVEAAIE